MLITCSGLLLYFIPKVSALETAASVDREILLEETFLHQLENFFYDITKEKAYFCEKIQNIERIKSTLEEMRMDKQLVELTQKDIEWWKSVTGSAKCHNQKWFL